MKKLFLFLALAGSFSVFAQKKPVNPKPYAATITEADLKRQLYIIAGAEMEGRETATEGQRKAAAYIESQFKALGLQPGNNGSYQVSFPVYKDSLLAARMVVNGKNIELNQDFQPITQINTSGEQFFSEIVFVGHGIVDSAWDDYGNTDVRGKAVMIVDGTPTGYKPKAPGMMSPAANLGKIRNARNKGAVAVLIVGPGFPRRPAGSTSNMYVNLFKPAQYPNAYFISDKVAEALAGPGWNEMKTKAKGEKATPAVIETETELVFQKQVNKLESTNVLGFVEGTDKKDEWLVLSAHYDHLGKRGDVIYYGADDDGSGTVGIIEIAEAFAKAKAAGKGPRRSVLFMTVSGEEKGLWGSEYYSENPTLQLDKVTANLNIDMIGRVDTERTSADSLNYVYVVGDDKLSTELKPTSEAANKKYTKLNLDYKFNDPNDKERIYYRSDHYNFARKGVPIIFYYDGMLKADYHKPTDTPDKINYPLYHRRTLLVFYTAWEMANRENMMKRDLTLPE